MKSVLLSSVTAGLLFGLLFPMPQGDQRGAYNTFSGWAYCADHYTCLHEIGHALDWRAGRVSQSDIFYKAVQMYLLVELRKQTLSPLPVNILELTYRARDKREAVKVELYAYLFAESGGDRLKMPEGLRPFYDWNEAARLTALLNNQQKLYNFR